MITGGPVDLCHLEGQNDTRLPCGRGWHGMGYCIQRQKGPKDQKELYCIHVKAVLQRFVVVAEVEHYKTFYQRTLKIKTEIFWDGSSATRTIVKRDNSS